MKDLLAKLGGQIGLPIFLLITGLIIGSIWQREKDVREWNSRPAEVVHTRDTISIPSKPIEIVKWKTKEVIIRDTIPPAPSPAYVARGDTTVDSVRIQWSFLHPEKVMSHLGVKRPPTVVYIDSVRVEYRPVLVPTTDWEVIWKVGVAGLAIGYIIGEVVNASN